MHEEIEIKENNEETTDLAPVNDVEVEEKKSGLGWLVGGAAALAVGGGIYKMFFSKEAKAKRQTKKLEKAMAEVKDAGYFITDYDPSIPVVLEDDDYECEETDE